ncbi:MAG: hypothetical protein JWM86_1161 [Thermoleophilia bacterium]|nr:hypothetical protein [Thermoleophilia bacterium]
MTMIDVDTSPLQAAREWRGINLVQASMNSGLPMSQAEALEEGDPDAFGSIDEMIAAAVVYGASIGIGRDEAMALLDRTVSRSGVQVELPETRPNMDFSGAVAERSARIADRPETSQAIAIEPMAHAVPVAAATPVAPLTELPVVPTGPTPEQAVAASGEMEIEEIFADAPWERSSSTGELATWVEDYDSLEAASLSGQSRAVKAPGRGARAGATMHSALERVVGTDRADATADWVSGAPERVGDVLRDGRERLRRSEHATLIVAIGGGALLIALLVAIGGALGKDDAAGPGPAKRSEPKAAAPATLDSTAGTTTTTEAAAVKPATPAAIVPPAKITVDVFNSGSQKGRAKEVAAQLKAAGYRVGQVTNARNYAGATIIHPKAMEREARLLARRTGVTTLQVAPGSTTHITVVVA